MNIFNETLEFNPIEEFKDSKKIFDSSKFGSSETESKSHSALTPTLKLPEKLSKEEEIVYQVIFNRFVANFLAEETIVSETILTIQVADKEFKLKGTEIIKAGFYAYEPKKFDNQLPNLVENEEFEISCCNQSINTYDIFPFNLFND